MKKYISSERVNLFEPNAYISFIVRLRGIKDTDKLVDAVISAYNANESTMSRIVLEQNGMAYYDKLQRSECKGKFLDKYADPDIRVKLYSSSLNRNWRKNPSVFGWDDYYMLHDRYWKRHSTSLRIQNYDISTLERQRAKGTTINSVIITELLKQYPEISSVGIPVSIRDQESLSVMGNLTSGIHIRYRYRPWISFDRNLTNAHKSVYRILDSNKDKYFVLRFLSDLDPALIDASLLCSHGCFENKYAYFVGQLFGYTGSRKRQLGVSNLGRRDFDGIFRDVFVEELIFVPPKVSYVQQVVGVSTLGDKLTLCFHDIIEN